MTARTVSYRLQVADLANRCMAYPMKDKIIWI